MPTVCEILEERLHDALVANGVSTEGPLEVAATADPHHGDYQTNAAMVLGKKLNQNPRALATLIVNKLDMTDIGAAPEIAGPGFINFRLSSEFLADRVYRLGLDERLGVECVERPKTVVIDFSSPNIAKPIHVGHIRSTILGSLWHFCGKHDPSSGNAVPSLLRSFHPFRHACGARHRGRGH
jgi:arginyl-tRNA synthetase